MSAVPRPVEPTPAVPVPAGHCHDCRRPTGLPRASYCDRCRWRHRGKKRRWVLTPEREAVLVARYRLSGATAFARSWGWPRWAVAHAAARLGLARPGTEMRRAWTPEEVAILEANAGERAFPWLCRRLKRSRASVGLKLKRLQLSRRVTSGYTLGELEEALGADHRTLQRWLREGKLRGKRRFGGDTVAAFERDAWHFTDADVLLFIRENRHEVRLERFDQDWFLGLVLPSKGCK